MSTRLRRLAMAPDTAHRHREVARLCAGARSVLDVGGVRGQLAAFLGDAEIVTLNLEDEGDEQFAGDTIPRPDGSFDMVVSLDVLEHIPAPERERHFRECLRVARERVVVCCPLGTPEHIEAERELHAWIQEVYGREDHFLAEHLERGLPTLDELRGIADAMREEATARFAFQGDFRIAAEGFRSGAALQDKKTAGAVLRYGKARLRAQVPERLEDQPKPHTNRVFLILDRV